MNRTEALPLVAYVLTDALGVLPLDQLRADATLIGFPGKPVEGTGNPPPPVFVAVQSYLPGVTIGDQEAEEIALDYLDEIDFFTDGPTEPLYRILPPGETSSITTTASESAGPPPVWGAPSIGECLYGEHDETEGTLTEARGFLIVDSNGDHLCIVPGADDTYSVNSPGAATARRVATVLGRDAGLLAFVQRIAALQLYGSEMPDGDVDDPGEDAMDALNDAIEEARTLTATVTAYVLVIGSQDQTFVGPFPNLAAATAYADRKRASNPQFEFSPMTEAAMRANMAEHGDCPLQSPDADEGE